MYSTCQSRVRWFDSSTLSVTFTPSSIPWWLVYYLGKKSMKHTFVPKNCPSLSKVHNSLDNFVNRLKWSIHMELFNTRVNDVAFDPVVSRLKIKSGKMAPTSPKPMESLIGQFKSNVFDSIKRTSRRNRASGRALNKSLLDHRAEWCLWSLGLAVFESDKGGSWVITNLAGVQALEHSILSNGSYIPFSTQLDLVQLNKYYASNVMRVTREHPSRSKLRKFMLTGEARRLVMDGFYAKVRAKVEDHKPYGKVKARAIHDNTSHPWNSAASFVSAICEWYNSRADWLVKDSSHFLFKIESLLIDSHDVVMCFDVADYYPNADHARVTDSSIPAFTAYIYTHSIDNDKFRVARDAWVNLVRMLVDTQFVKTITDSTYFK